MKSLLVFGVLAVAASAVSAEAIHHGYIWIEGPDEVLQANTTYTLEVWGRWESPLFVDGVSAMAGFWFDVINTAGSGTNVASVGNLQIAEWALGFSHFDGIDGTNLVGVAGGQLADLFGWGPRVDRTHPIMLFEFDFTTSAGPVGPLAFSPMNPEPGIGLSFYLRSTAGEWIGAPNGTDSELHLVPWVYVPSPNAVALIMLAGVQHARRRR